MELLSPPLYDQPIPEQEPDQTESIDSLPEQEIVTEIMKRYEASERYQAVYLELAKELWNLFRFYKSAESSVKIFNPIGFALTVGLLSKMFVKPPKFILSSKTGGWKWLAKILQSYLEHQFANPDAEEPMEEEFISFVTEMLVTGTAVGKVCWKTKFVNQYQDVPSVDEMGQPTSERQKQRVKGFDDPVFEHVPLEYFKMQPGAKSIAESTYCMLEKWVDDDYLRDLSEITDPATGTPLYRNLDTIITGSGFNDRSYDKEGVKRAKKPNHVSNENEEYAGKHHLIEYWEDDVYCVVIDKNILIRGAEDNPYDHGKKPFVHMQYVKVPGEFYGIGAMEPTMDLQKATNITLTQRVEYVANLLNQQFGVLNGATVDEDALIDGYPIVHTSTADAIFPLQKGNVTQASFVNAEELVGAIERGMGISGYAVGAPAAANDKTQGTLGGIQTIVAEAQTRFDMTLRRFENIVLRKIAQLYLDLDRQYFSEFEQKVVMVSDGQIPAPITKELLQLAEWRVDIVPGSTGLIDKQRKSQQFMAWAQFATTTITNFNRELAVIEAGDYAEVENPERYIIQMQPALPPGAGVTPPQELQPQKLGGRVGQP